jgi:type IV secretion system protein TrbJ
MRNMRSKLVIGACLLWVVQPAKAQWVVTDPTLTMKSVASEAARLGQTATMIQNQVNEYQNMIYNTVTLANPVLKPIGDLARTAASTYYRGQSLMYQAQNLDQQFGYMYPGYVSYQNLAMNVGRGGQTLESKYQDWSDKGYSNVRTALQAANIKADDMEKDTDMLGKLVNQANSTGGQMQALQGIGQLMGQQNKQMTGLQELALTQVRLQANYYGMVIERQSAFDASEQQFRSTRPMNSRGMGF